MPAKGQRKPITNCEHVDRVHHSGGRCRDCVGRARWSDPVKYAHHKKNTRDLYHAKREEILAKLRAKRISDPEGFRRIDFARKLREHYGIDIADYEHHLELQCGVCKICKELPPTGSRVKRLSVDHCHSTGHIRGLLCSKCNAGLGQFCDNTELLAKAIEYLRENSPKMVANG